MGEFGAARAREITKTPEQILEQFGIRVEYPDPEKVDNIPFLDAIDLSVFPSQHEARSLMENALAFLRAPYVTYPTFDNHEQQRELRRQLEYQYPEVVPILEADKFRVNELSALSLSAELLGESLQAGTVTGSNAEEIVSLLRALPNAEDIQDYKQASMEEKREIIHDIEDTLFALIMMLTKPKAMAHSA